MAKSRLLVSPMLSCDLTQCIHVCVDLALAKPLAGRAVPYFTTGVAKPLLTQIEAGEICGRCVDQASRGCRGGLYNDVLLRRGGLKLVTIQSYGPVLPKVAGGGLVSTDCSKSWTAV